jgi:hypothetical protein
VRYKVYKSTWLPKSYSIRVIHVRYKIKHALKAIFVLNTLGLRKKVVDKLLAGQSFQSQLVLVSNKKDQKFNFCILQYKNLSLASVKIEYGNFAYKKPLKNLFSGKSQQWGANYVVYPVRVAVIPNSNSFTRLTSIIETIVNEFNISTFTCSKTTLAEKLYCKNNWSVLGEEVPNSKALVPQGYLLFNVYESVWNVTDTIKKKYNNTVKSCTRNKDESTRWSSFISYNNVYKIAVYTWTRQLSWVECSLRFDLSANKVCKVNWTLFEFLAALQMFLAQMFWARLFVAELADFYFASKEQKMLSFRHCSEEFKRLRKYNGRKLISFLINLTSYNKRQAIYIKYQGLFIIV